MNDPFDIVRMTTGLSALGFGAYLDVRTRSAPRVLWVATSLVGVILLGAESFAGRRSPQVALGLFLVSLAFALIVVLTPWGGLADRFAVGSVIILVPSGWWLVVVTSFALCLAWYAYATRQPIGRFGKEERDVFVRRGLPYLVCLFTAFLVRVVLW